MGQFYFCSNVPASILHECDRATRIPCEIIGENVHNVEEKKKKNKQKDREKCYLEPVSISVLVSIFIMLCWRKKKKK